VEGLSTFPITSYRDSPAVKALIFDILIDEVPSRLMVGVPNAAEDETRDGLLL